MTHRQSKTAILLFAQSASVDANSKSLAGTSVLDVLNNHILKTVQATGLDYYHFTEKEQRGTGFGTRFTNAIQDVFKLGYKSVICLGNDTPLLTLNLLDKAAQSLQYGNAVKGKSIDGGLYLIGLNRAQFNAKQFETLPWQSTSLAASFHEYINDLNSDLIILKSLQDIDSTADLHRFLAGKDARINLIRLLLSTLSRKRNNTKSTVILYKEARIAQPTNKGSPYSTAA